MFTISRTLRRALLAGAALGAIAGAAHAQDDSGRALTPDERIARLEARINELQDQVADLKSSTASNIRDVREQSQATTVSLANGRPTFASADGQFTASIRGVLQLDAAFYNQDSPGPLGTDFRRGSFGDAGENDHARDLSDGANFRRARIGIEGKAFGDFEYNFLYDFGGSGTEEAGKISAAWVQYNGFGPVRLRVGAFSAPTGLEEVVSTNGSLFAERASPAELVRGLASGDGRTAAGVFANGDRWTASGAVTGNVIGTSTFDEQLAFVGRASFVPFKREDALIHLGVNTSIIAHPAKTGPDIPGGVATTVRLRDRPELRVDGTRLVDTGNIDADQVRVFGAELGGQWKAFYGQAEYYDIQIDRRASLLDDPSFSGWYVQAGWTITGEPRRYSTVTGGFDAPRPAKNFSLKDGQWGAWELGLRYSVLDLNYEEGSAILQPASAVRGGEQKILTLGLNWYLNPAMRFQAAWQKVEVDRLSPGGTAFGAGVATPAAGTQVGQDLDIFSLRTQYAF